MPITMDSHLFLKIEVLSKMKRNSISLSASHNLIGHHNSSFGKTNDHGCYLIYYTFLLLNLFFICPVFIVIILEQCLLDQMNEGFILPGRDHPESFRQTHMWTMT